MRGSSAGRPATEIVVRSCQFSPSWWVSGPPERRDEGRAPAKGCLQKATRSLQSTTPHRDARPPNSVSSLDDPTAHQHRTVNLGIVHGAHNRSLLSEQRAHFGGHMAQPFGRFNHRPRIKHHLVGRSHPLRCHSFGTHPPPRRSATKISMRSGPSSITSTSSLFLQKSRKSVDSAKSSPNVIWRFGSEPSTRAEESDIPQSYHPSAQYQLSCYLYNFH